MNELKESFAREIKKTCSELKSYYDNKEESMKFEIRNLQLQIEHLKKENIDLKSKAKITKLRKCTKTQPTSKNLMKVFKNTTKQDRNCVRTWSYNTKQE